MAGPVQAMGSENTKKDICEMLRISAQKSYQVEALQAAWVNKSDTLVCADWERKICVLSRDQCRDRPCHWLRARTVQYGTCD